MSFDLTSYIERHREWSQRTFGDVATPTSVTSHIRKELDEIMGDPSDLMEWVDVMILAIDGAWRFAGATPEEISATLGDKQAINAARKWSTPVKDMPTEHERGGGEKFVVADDGEIG